MSSILIGPFTVGEKPPQLQYQFQDSDGAPIDLNGYTAKFEMREMFSGSVVFNATVSDADHGIVTYTWAGTEMPTPGHYTAQFWVGNGTFRFASVTIRFDAAITAGPAPAV